MYKVPHKRLKQIKESVTAAAFIIDYLGSKKEMDREDVITMRAIVRMLKKSIKTLDNYDLYNTSKK